MAVYPISPNDVCEVTITAVLANQIVFWTHHYKYIDATVIADGNAELGLLTTALRTTSAVYTKLKGLQTSDVAYQEMRTQIVFPARRPYHSFDLRPDAGTKAPPTAPPNVACFINKQSSIVGRGRHGGWHICGVDLASISAGIMDPAYIALANVAAGLWNTDVLTTSGSHWHPVIFNPRNPTPQADIFGTFTERTSRIERRRTVGVGI
jgi:hypothetical protein